MKNIVPIYMLFGLCVISTGIHAHSHHTTVIVEAPLPVPVPTVIVQAPMPAPVPDVMVEVAPPAEIEEQMTMAPGPNYVWVRGNWQWDGRRYVRIHGHWAARPNGVTAYVPGYWKQHSTHWKWHEGYWQ